jgi:hypothetical protein
MRLYIDSMTARGQNPHIGASLAQLMLATGQFDEVSARTACIPLNPGVAHGACYLRAPSSSRR